MPKWMSPACKKRDVHSLYIWSGDCWWAKENIPHTSCMQVTCEHKVASGWKWPLTKSQYSLDRISHRPEKKPFFEENDKNNNSLVTPFSACAMFSVASPLSTAVCKPDISLNQHISVVQLSGLLASKKKGLKKKEGNEGSNHFVLSRSVSRVKGHHKAHWPLVGIPSERNCL